MFINASKQRKTAGFTMIELLVVATIIVILTSISFVSFQGTAVRSRNSKRQADITQVRAALETYRSVNSAYPVHATFSALTSNAGFTTFLATSAVQLVDPVNNATYRYTYVSASPGTTYSLCYYVEPTATQTCVTNP